MILKIFYTILPLFMGILVILLINFVKKGRFGKLGDLQPPYIMVIALQFALFSSLIYTEVWQRSNRVNALLIQEASMCRGLLRITESLPEAATLKICIRKLLNDIKKQELGDTILVEKLILNSETDVFSKAIWSNIYRIASSRDSMFNGNTTTQMVFYNLVESLRQAWFERKQLRKAHLPKQKLYFLFLFGLFTQISIGFAFFSDSGKRFVGIILFSLVFASAIGVLTVADDPFSTSYLINASSFEDVR